MKNIKLSIKLIGGFSLTAIIILAFGLISITQLDKLEETTSLLNKDALVAVNDALTLREDSAEAAILMHAILSPYLSIEERAGVMQGMIPIRKHMLEIKEDFSSLPFFKTIQPEWEDYSKKLSAWKKSNNKAMALSDELVAADIANPEQLTIDMLHFEADHKTLLNKANKLVLLGTPFEGGTNPMGCALGKWLLNMPTSNPQIVAEMKKVIPVHALLHVAVAHIKQLMDAGKKAEAEKELKNHLYPLSDEIFTHTEKVARLAHEYHNKFEEVNKTLLHEAEKNQHATFAALEAIVKKAREYADEYTDGAVATTSRGREIAILSMVIGTALALSLGVFLTLIITRPLAKGVDLAQSMADGDMTNELEIDQRDEIGTLASSLNNMTKQLRHMLTNVTSGVSEVTKSSKDLTGISKEMTSGAEDTANRSNQVAAAAEQMSANQNSVAAAMEQAATNVNMVAAATEQMKSTIAEISENSGRAKSITDLAVNKSKTASNRMEELGEAAVEINKVTETINEISSQTNLLALNATIEAASAGEAGKGFTVVAGEIKDLAKQTAVATLDIQQKIQGIQQATKMTVAEIDEINGVISEVDQVVTSIAAAVEQQAAATGEIVENVNQVSEGIAEVNENVAQSTTASAEIAAEISEVNNHANKMTTSSNNVKEMAEELAAVANKLQEMVARFKLSKAGYNAA